MTADTFRWPQDFASLTRHTIPLHLLDLLCREAGAIAKCDNFWTSQVYEPGKGLAFHFDKDERVMKARHQMLQPVLSSVLYLTGHSMAERLGPTAIIDQQYDAQQRKAVPDTPSRTALVFPNKNNYVLFDGRLGHGVLGSSSQQPRMTMLINWWAEKPQDVNTIPDHIIKQYALTTLSPSSDTTAEPDAHHSNSFNKANTDLTSQLQQISLDAAASSHSQDQSYTQTHNHAINKNHHEAVASSLPHPSAISEADPPGTVNGHSSTQHSAEPTSLLQEATRPHSNDEATSEHSAALERSHAAEQQAGAKPEQLRVPCISIAGWDESPVAVDEVLETYGLHLTGPQAIHAVAIDHTGFELFPLDEENLQANAGNIVTAAAFVPAGLVSDESDSASQSDNSS